MPLSYCFPISFSSINDPDPSETLTAEIKIIYEVLSGWTAKEKVMLVDNIGCLHTKGITYYVHLLSVM